MVQGHQNNNNYECVKLEVYNMQVFKDIASQGYGQDKLSQSRLLHHVLHLQ